MVSDEKYIAIFGHFYQPPRFNPWILEIDLDISSRPYHDWNDRITKESYLPNAYARLKDGEIIEDVVNNYKKVTFSFGPILLSYLKEKYSKLYNLIIEADKESSSKLSGHGNAIAQPYAHIIMPLSSKEDRERDIYWGIKFFEKTFDRYPEGFWLPEAAVDNLTLEILYDYGIKFVILSPHQAKSIKINDKFEEINEKTLDTKKVYRALLPSGNYIGVVFYNKWLSGLVAFGDLLKSGELFARKLIESFDNSEKPQLVSIATDGETYGHHKPKGEEELAKALSIIDSYGINITNYSYFYSTFGASYDITINENTSWSCPHGIERWRSNCGCASDIRPGWTQEWRTPLRKSIDWLRDMAEMTIQNIGSKVSNDINKAILNYVDVFYDYKAENVSSFIENFAIKGEENKIVDLLKLMEIAKNSILMQSSDAWFFEDIYRPEPIQSLRFAKRVIQLIEELANTRVEEQFLNILKDAKSNNPRYGNGKEIYEKEAIPALMTAEKVGASYAMRLLFETISKENDYYSYKIILGPYKKLELGRAKAVTGIATLISKITWRSTPIMFASIYYGWYNLHAGAKILVDQKSYIEFENSVTEFFNNGLLPDIIDILQKTFYPNYYNLNNLLKNDQKFIMDHVLDSAIIELARQYEMLYNNYLPVMEYVRSLNLNYPKVFELLLQFELEKSILEILEQEIIDFNRLEQIIQWSKNLEVSIDDLVHSLIREKIEKVLDNLILNPQDINSINILQKLLEISKGLDLPLEYLWNAQNKFIYLRNNILRHLISSEDYLMKTLIPQYKIISSYLKVRFP
ncbi:DUF3536 domain-containing protein [Caldisphaera sp.]|uniref:DUF3536 domain-containing protein n=1 Tax=Caldisphaera sp. TaxID=2060322 RepID=UPI0025BD0C43|nr:DUF3536 domain-containing protein [Caldisphaera sp.]